MTGSLKAGGPRLWISYPWSLKKEGDYAYLVSQLRDAKIEATYESLELQPGIPLWPRIAQRLLSIDFDGWLYILTHQCLSRRTCADELAEALGQTLRHLGADFPTVGLLHGIAAQHLPPMLRVRPCLSLADPDWKLRVVEALKHRSPHRKEEAIVGDSRFIWKIHPSYCGNPSITAIEVSPKLESIQYWRFAIPKSVQSARWGQGAAGGGEISPIKFAVAKGSGRYGSADVVWFGAANAVSPTESAYVVFVGPLPEFICFGPAESPMGPPGQMEMFRIGPALRKSPCDEISDYKRSR